MAAAKGDSPARSPLRSSHAEMKIKRVRTAQMLLKVSIASFAIGVAIHVASSFHYSEDAANEDVALAKGSLRRILLHRGQVREKEGITLRSMTKSFQENPLLSRSSTTELPVSTSSTARSDKEEQSTRQMAASGSSEQVQSSQPLPQIILDHLAFPGTEVCGRWHSPYSEMHQKMRTGKMKPKYLTFRPSRTGLGDNLLGLVSSFIAALISERAFILADSDLSTVFETAEIDWRQSKEVPMEVDSLQEGGVKDGSVVLLHKMNGGDEMSNMVQFPTDLVQLFSMRLGPAANVIIESNGGIVTRVMEQKGLTFQILHRLGLDKESAFGCVVRYLLRPKAEVVQLVQAPLSSVLQADMSSVCVHFRSGDELAWDTSTGQSLSNITKAEELYAEVNSQLLSCAAKVSKFWQKEGQSQLWLFLSDMRELAELVQQRHREQVLISPNTPRHPQFQGKQALTSSVADWLLLSGCKSHIITESGFSKTAVAYNLRRPHYYLFDFGEGSTRVSGDCSPEKPNSLSDFKLRSGL